MDQGTINVLLIYFSLIFAPLFLFGAIKMRSANPGKGASMIVLGFTLLTLVAILDAAEYCDLFAISYEPYLDNDYGYYYGIEWRPWEKYYYYTILGIRNLGGLIASVGLVMHGRFILANIRHLPHTKQPS